MPDEADPSYGRWSRSIRSELAGRDHQLVDDLSEVAAGIASTTGTGSSEARTP